jgi:hypothetical protein
MEIELNKQNKEIEESKDELMQCVRREVEDILHLFFNNNDTETCYEVRNETVMFVYLVLIKKYHYHSKFDEIKKQMARTIGYDYLCTKNLVNLK